MKAVFLDRDGVINMERGDYTCRLEDFKFVPGIFENLKKLQEAGFLLIVVSNQGGIAKNRFTQKDVETLHDYMVKSFKKHNINLAEVYYCPHHPSTGNCICRKPDSLMLEKAMARFAINPAKACFIGDRDRDMEAGKKAGLKTIKIADNQ